MPGIDSDMSLKEALRSLIASCAAAYLVWFMAALLLEKLIPGFVSPFIDLADLGLIAVIVAATFVGTAGATMSGWKKALIAATVMGMSGVALALLWFSLSGLGTLYLVLSASIALTILFSLYAILFAPRVN